MWESFLLFVFFTRFSLTTSHWLQNRGLASVCCSSLFPFVLRCTSPPPPPAPPGEMRAWSGGLTR